MITSETMRPVATGGLLGRLTGRTKLAAHLDVEISPDSQDQVHAELVRVREALTAWGRKHQIKGHVTLDVLARPEVSDSIERELTQMVRDQAVRSAIGPGVKVEMITRDASGEEFTTTLQEP